MAFSTNPRILIYSHIVIKESLQYGQFLVKEVKYESEDSLESTGAEPTKHRERDTRNRRQREGTHEQNPIILTERYLPVKNHHEKGWKITVK